MEIAVLGGGNGSHAAAVDLSSLGHKVRFWRRDADAIADLRQNGNRLVMKDFSGLREVDLDIVTDDISKAISGAELIVCPTPATAQESIAQSTRAPSCRWPGHLPAARHIWFLHHGQGCA